MENSLLVLCPVDPHWILPDSKGLVELLKSIQLIGELYQGNLDFLPGERFLDLIAFLGCSPDIKLAPGDNDRQFCFLRLLTDTPSIEYHGGDHTCAPRCPLCGAALDDWHSTLMRWQQSRANATLTCTTCQSAAAPWEYNWRKSAGFGRCFIEINNIFPKEAIPQQQLLDTLHSHYQVDWQYFYQY